MKAAAKFIVDWCARRDLKAKCQRWRFKDIPEHFKQQWRISEYARVCKKSGEDGEISKSLQNI